MAQTQTIASPALRTEPAKPLLTLALATYNRARYLDRYLTHHLTAFEAAGIDYELFVSDNCSTDETPDILARYASRHKGMRVIRQERNIGAYPNILNTLRGARGEIVVSIADDDLMVPHQLLNYVRRMQENNNLVMVQAPWFLADETKDNAIIGKFYDFDGERLFSAGDYAGCLQFLIQHHVFPECWLIRGAAIPSTIGPAPRFAYHFFNVLTRALGLGDVLFSPDPHIVATAVSKGDNHHAGNLETMEGWDRYRGGLEVMASHARQFQPNAMGDAGMLAQALQSFTLQRMSVAARLHCAARNWSDAYHLQRRMHAYGCDAPLPVGPTDLSRLTAVETAIQECQQLGATRILFDERVSAELLAALKPTDGVVVERGLLQALDDRRTAICHISDPAAVPEQPHVFGYDIMAGMHRYLAQA